MDDHEENSQGAGGASDDNRDDSMMEDEVQSDIIASGGDDGTHVMVGGVRSGYRLNEKRTTSSFMTKYEKARVLGTRALHLSKNAPPLIDLQQGDTDPYKIAERELAAQVIPLIIRRYLPDYTYEDWHVKELTCD